MKTSLLQVTQTARMLRIFRLGFFPAFFLFFTVGAARANNIAISSVSVTGKNSTTKTTDVIFNLSWENSWLHNSTGGSISYIGVKTGGTGYNSPPTVTVSAPGGGGTTATATATITGGKVTGFTITNAGSGYTSVPTVSFSGGGGSGASADAHIASWWDAAWVFVKFRVGGDTDPTFTGVSSSGTTVTVSSTANLRVGMPVSVTSGTGTFAANTVISSITNTTQFVVSEAPTTPLSSASITCVRIWEHARLDSSGHVAASGSSITPGLLTPGSAYNATSNPALGVFIYRSAAGSGNNLFSSTGLKWNYGANDVADDAQVDVRVFATEMVYVPQGSFYVGSGGTDYHEWGSFTDGSKSFGPQGVSAVPQGRTSIPYRITSENAIDIDNVSGKLWGMSNDLSINQSNLGHHIGNSTDAAI